MTAAVIALAAFAIAAAIICVADEIRKHRDELRAIAEQEADERREREAAWTANTQARWY